MIFRRLCQIVMHICMETAFVSLINIRTLQKSKMFKTKNFELCENDLLIKMSLDSVEKN